MTDEPIGQTAPPTPAKPEGDANAMIEEAVAIADALLADAVQFADELWPTRIEQYGITPQGMEIARRLHDASANINPTVAKGDEA